MINRFIDKIACGASYDPAQVVGYSEGELVKIERLFDIEIRGELREFMLDMGRCDGGLIGDDPIILYRPNMSLRRHIMYQLRLEFSFKEFQIEAGLNLLRLRPFLFSCESETQYFFVLTKTDTPNIVYHYDENNETVKDTGLNFLDYMKQTVQSWGGKSAVVCRGELLIV